MFAAVDAYQTVFPARAGMSLIRAKQTASNVSFPRPRGDEPTITGATMYTRKFSPPARG